MLAALKADAVVVATGAAYRSPAIPGIDKACVVGVRDYLKTPPAGLTIAIIGGDMAGLQLAEWLHGAGKTVTVVTDAARLGAGLPIVRRARLLAELRQKSVTLAAGARDIAIGEGEVTWRDTGDRIGRASADRVIVTIGAVANLGLVQKLSAAGFAVSAVGDCTGELNLESAIRAVADLVDRM
jgi:pyruvate/2-oxoglutarate dehydrogenase complex dihydrolipoamide dehydrogenase (E3) component